MLYIHRDGKLVAEIPNTSGTLSEMQERIGGTFELVKLRNGREVPGLRLSSEARFEYPIEQPWKDPVCIVIHLYPGDILRN